MGQEKNSSQGFTLIAALLILVLLSGVAVGLLFTVTNDSRMGGNGLESNRAFYGAESGMEKLTADLSALYTQFQVPTNAQIQNLVNFPPSAAMVNGMTYNETISYPLDANGNPVSSFNTVSSGSNQGLYAEIIPMTLQVIATRPGGASVNVTRKVEVAQIPVFQFGVFCGYDCSYFPGPDFGFGGRVHTNQNLFLAIGDTKHLVFNDKLSAFQQVIMDQLENGWGTTTNYNGTVYVPKASGGCILNGVYPPVGPNCVALPDRRNGSRRCQLERRLSHDCRRRQHQLPQHLVRRHPEWLRHQLAHRRQEHAVALRAEFLHQQPAALHRSNFNRPQTTSRRVVGEHARYFPSLQQGANPHPARRYAS